MEAYDGPVTTPAAKKRLAVIIPVYNEQATLRTNFLEILHTFQEDGIEGQFMFVDDGSGDGTWQVLAGLCAEFSHVWAIRFPRNFGKEVALSAGLDVIDADLYLTMDSDLQHPPRCVKEMLHLLETTQANIIEGVKVHRGKESLKDKLLAKGFYLLLKMVAGLEMNNSSDFKLMDRQVIETLRRFQERNLFFRGIVGWMGFKSVPFPFEVAERTGGKSRFSPGKLLMLTLNAVLSYTGKPLYLTIISGLLFLVFAVGLGLQTLYNYFFGHAVSGFSTVIILILITGAMILISLGVIGVYISRIYEEIKGRPRYIISDVAAAPESAPESS